MHSIQEVPTSERLTMGDIIDTIGAADGYETLVALLRATGLAEVLRSPGPFTLFAPSDDAFEQLPSGTLDELLDDIPGLAALLRYHVVPHLFERHVSHTMAITLLDQAVYLQFYDGQLVINDIVVTQPHLVADNGVIFRIRQVLTPS